MDGLPVTIRTYDLGADKHLNGASACANPALGLRAIRLWLAEPQMFQSSCARSCAPRTTARSRMLIPML